MSLDEVFAAAQSHMSSRGIDGWLLYDYRGVNPIFWETVGPVSNVTRPCWLWVPAEGAPRLLIAYVDQGRFGHLGVATTLYSGREEMVSRLEELVDGFGRVAMEYSPAAELPRISRVDAGTVELVRSLGVDVVSSADTVQYAAQRWTTDQLASHETAADALGVIVRQAFDHIGSNLARGITELEVAEFISTRFVDDGLEVTDGPVVAVNEHSSDPHFEPTPDSTSAIRQGDWVLIDLWSRLPGPDSMFADITWTAFVGDEVPERHQSGLRRGSRRKGPGSRGDGERLPRGPHPAGLAAGQGLPRLYRGRRLRGLLQPQAGAQPRERGPRKRRQSR